MLLLDATLPPVALLLLVAYHVYLWRLFVRDPQATVIGSNNSLRRLWVFQVMRAKGKKDILAVQTMRNWIMGSSMLATLSVTLAFGIIAFFGSKTIGSVEEAAIDRKSMNSPVQISKLNFGGSDDFDLYVGKLFALVFIFLVCFFSFSQSIRLLNHCVFTINILGDDVPPPVEVGVSLKAKKERDDHDAFSSQYKAHALSHENYGSLLRKEASKLSTSSPSLALHEDDIDHQHHSESETAALVYGFQEGRKSSSNMIETMKGMQDTRHHSAASAETGTNNMIYTEDDLVADVDFVATILNRAGIFYTIGMRGYYISLPVITWLFGPIPCICTAVLVVVCLPFLDIHLTQKPRLLRSMV